MQTEPKERERVKMIDTVKVSKIDVGKILPGYAELQPGASEKDAIRSWDHCRSAFAGAASARFGAAVPLPCRGALGGACGNTCDCTLCGSKCKVCDRFLSLQLAFYLASFGMYRGSSFLCRFDYTVHLGAVKILMDPSYCRLFSPDLFLTDRGRYVNLMSEVYKSLLGYYEDIARGVCGANGKAKHASDTLITKILLGVYGSMPAYDSYFREGIGTVGGTKYIFGSNIDRVLEELADVAAILMPQITAALSAACGTWDRCGVYTPMRIVDMVFWKIGETSAVAVGNGGTAAGGGIASSGGTSGAIGSGSSDASV